MHDAEVDEADAAGSMRGDLRIGSPAIDHAPIVEYHVVDAVGHDRPAIPDDVDIGAVDGKDAAGDLVSRAGRNATIAVDRIGFQPPHVEPAGLVTAAADENAAAANRRAVAARREADEIGADNHAGVLLHVPERECPVDDIDAVTVRPLLLAAGVGCDNVEPGDIDMAAAHLVASENLNAAGRRDAAQFDPPEACDGGIVEYRSLVRGGVKTNIVNPIIRRKLKSVGSGVEGDGRVFVLTPQELSGSEANGRHVDQIAVDDNSLDACVLGQGDQFFSSGG